MPHIHDQIDFVGNAYIVHSGRVLLVDHRELGLWLQPGGHVELDEDTDRALWREIEEETGLTPSQLEILSEKIDFGEGATISLWPPRWVNIHRINERHRHIGLNYLLRAKSDAIRLAEREHSAIRWFSAEELDDPALNTPADIRFYSPSPNTPQLAAGMKARRITLPKLAEGERRRVFGYGRIPLDTAQLCCAELHGREAIRLAA